jgi:hypothetical protein
MFAAKLIPEIQRLKRAATPRDSEDIFFTTGPDGFEARLRQKPKPAAAAPAPAETAAGTSDILIACTTARTAAKTYTVDIYSGYTATGTIDVANRIEEDAVMITPNLNDTETVDQLPNGTNLAVMVGNYANPDYDPENPEAEPERITRYFPIEHVGLI